jgi:hypothetical protein
VKKLPKSTGLGICLRPGQFASRTVVDGRNYQRSSRTAKNVLFSSIRAT